MSRPRNLPSLQYLLSLAIGVLAIWGFAVVVVISQLNSPTPYFEAFGVDATGELVIESYSDAGGVNRNRSWRYASGEEVDRPRHELVHAALLTAGQTPRHWEDGPITWSERLMTTNDTWYLVRDGAAQGSAYIVGFDRESRLPTQYVGRSGVSTTPPNHSEYFQVGPPFTHQTPRIISKSEMIYVDFAIPGMSNDLLGTLAATLYILDGDNLIEVDLTSRTVRTLMSLPQAQSMAIVQQPITDDSSETTKPVTVDGAMMYRHRMAARLAIRTQTSVVIVDPSDFSKVEFMLPADLQTAQFNLYALRPEMILIDHGAQDGRDRMMHHLTWIEAGKDVVRTEAITIRSGNSENVTLQVACVAALAPMLAIFLPLTLLFLPSTLLQASSAGTYADGLWQTLSGIWPATLTLAVVSLIVAYLVLRWEHKHGRPHPWRWAVATFLLGVPGFIAYILLNGRKTLVSPRRERPATPALLGTELFA